MTNFARVRWVISEELRMPKEDINEDSLFVEDLNFDSLDHIEVVIGIEKEFDVEISDEEIDDVKSVKDLLSLLEKFHIIIPAATEMFNECLVPYCGISTEMSHCLITFSDTPVTSFPNTIAVGSS